MNANTLFEYYKGIDKSPLAELASSWAEENHPDLNITDAKKLFYNSYFKELKKEEQDKLIEKQEKYLRERYDSVYRGMSIMYDRPEYTFEEYCKIANDINAYIKANPNATIYGVNVPDLPKMPKLCSPEEKEQRKALSIKARDAFIHAMSGLIRSNNIVSTNKLTSMQNMELERSTETALHLFDEKGNDTYKKNIALISEPLIEVPKCPVESKNMSEDEKAKFEADMAAYKEAKQARENQENKRRELLDKVLNESIKYVKILRKPMSDEEFVNKFSDEKSLRMLQLLAEMQESNIKGYEKDFGVSASKEVEEKWKDLTGEMVSIGAMFTRLGFIGNAFYCESKDYDGLRDFFNYFDSEFMDEGGMRNKFLVNELIDTPRLISRSAYINASLSFNKDAIETYFTAQNGYLTGVISDEYNIAREDVQFQDFAGNPLSLKDTYKKVCDGMSCRIVNSKANKYIGLIKPEDLDKAWGGLREPDIPANYKIDEADPEELQQNMKELNNGINASTHWYMKSSKEFKNLRSVMSDLMEKDAFKDREKAFEKMSQALKYAKEYIALKQQPKTEITENTKKRLDIAYKISTNFERTLQESRFANKLEHNNIEKKPMVVNEANDVAKQGIANEAGQPAKEIVAENVMK